MSKSADDQEFFLTLVGQHQRMLLKVCWAYTRSSHDREDLFQEIVARLWSAFGTYDRNRTFSTWMYRVALNVAIDFRRRQMRRRDETANTDVTNQAASHSDGQRQELLEELHELLERQSDADRAILVLHLEGNSHREIAEIIGISESNVGTRLSRLKESLRASAHTAQEKP